MEISILHCVAGCIRCDFSGAFFFIFFFRRLRRRPHFGVLRVAYLVTFQGQFFRKFFFANFFLDFATFVDIADAVGHVFPGRLHALKAQTLSIRLGGTFSRVEWDLNFPQAVTREPTSQLLHE